jgi:hypothetical protein
VEAVEYLRLILQLMAVQVALLEVLQLRLAVAVRLAGRGERQVLQAQQVHLLLAEQAEVEVEQIMEAQVVLVVQEDSPEVAELAVAVEHPQVVLVAMVRLVV